MNDVFTHSKRAPGECGTPWNAKLVELNPWNLWNPWNPVEPADGGPCGARRHIVFPANAIKATPLAAWSPRRVQGATKKRRIRSSAVAHMA